MKAFSKYFLGWYRSEKSVLDKIKGASNKTISKPNQTLKHKIKSKLSGTKSKTGSKKTAGAKRKYKLKTKVGTKLKTNTKRKPGTRLKHGTKIKTVQIRSKPKKAGSKNKLAGSKKGSKYLKKKKNRKVSNVKKITKRKQQNKR